MNNFNPDQKTHILSNPERGSGGFGGNNTNEFRDRITKTERRRKKAELAAKKKTTTIPVAEDGDNNSPTEEQKESGLEGGERRVNAGEVEYLEGLPPLDEEGINTEIPVEATVEGEKEEDQELPPLEDEPNFNIDPETGLSKALTEINNLQAQIQSLEDRGDRYQEIQSEITTARAIEKTNLENSLQENKTKLNKIYTDIFIIAKATGEFTGSEAQKATIDKYLERHKEHTKVSPIKAEYDDFKSEIKELTTKLETLDTETESQIQAKVEAEKVSLQESLAKAQGEYSGSEAEANDKKVLLERQLQEKLTKPDELFSEDNIASIFAIYGLQEGQDKIQELKQESDRAVEQAARDKIKDTIVNNLYLYLDSKQNSYQPELAEAILNDLTPRLESLLINLDQNSTEYKEIQRILDLEATKKLIALVSSKNPQLNNLAFWDQFSNQKDRTTAEILADNTNLADYVSKETDKEYQRKIEEQRQNSHFTREAQNLETGIKERISRQFETAKEKQINTLDQEKASLLSDKYDLEYKESGLIASEAKITQAESDTTAINEKISELGRGKFKFEEGSFNSVENSDIVQKQQEISQQSEQAKQSIKGLIKNTDGVPADIKTMLTREEDPRQIILKIQSQIDTIKNKKRYKLTFGLWGGGKIKALTQLQNSLRDDISQYSNLESRRQANKAQYDVNNASIYELNQLYKALPDRIKNSLAQLENPNNDSIIQTINGELKTMKDELDTEQATFTNERKPRIQALQEQIATLEAKINKIKNIELAN